jgi:hypothetical protein
MAMSGRPVVGQAQLIVLRDAHGHEHAWKPTLQGDAWQITDSLGQQRFGVVSAADLLRILTGATAVRADDSRSLRRLSA